MHAAHVSRVTAVAAPELYRRTLEHEHGCAGFPRGQSRTQPSVSATDDNDVRFYDLFSHALQSYIITAKDTGEDSWLRNGIWSGGNS